MPLFLFCFWFGFAGFLMMALLGVHHGNAGGAHGHGAGHGAGPAHPIGGHGAHGHHAQLKLPSMGKLARGADWKSLTVLLSPRVIFSLLLGFGAAGLLIQPHLTGLPLLAIAIPSALLFEFGIVNPIWKLLFRFASIPSRSLEDSLLDEAEAATDFDSTGRGLVRVHLNGQMIQMLARAYTQPGDGPAIIRTGDKLWIMAVDPKRNSCTVARLLPDRTT